MIALRNLKRHLAEFLKMTRERALLALLPALARAEKAPLVTVHGTSRKILYVGHSYHAKTRSTAFLIDFLKEHFEVDVLLDESWSGGPKPDLTIATGQYRAVIFFQLIPSVAVLNSLPCKNIVLFPMFDGAIHEVDFWFPYRKFKIVNFSRKLHGMMLSWGLQTLHVPYFPPEKPFSPGRLDSVFFWQRTSRITIELVDALLAGRVKHIHMHEAPDPGHSFVAPSSTIAQRYEITRSSWFPTREGLWDVILECGLYIAPRETEGIGLSFLEAMASGKVVIAANRPTMNEYIVHGENGILFDVRDPQPLDLSDLAKMQHRAYESAAQGRAAWERAKLDLLTFLSQQEVRWPVKA